MAMRLECIAMAYSGSAQDIRHASGYILLPAYCTLIAGDNRSNQVFTRMLDRLQYARAWFFTFGPLAPVPERPVMACLQHPALVLASTRFYTV